MIENRNDYICQYRYELKLYANGYIKKIGSSRLIEVGSTCCRHFLTAGSSFFMFPFFDGPPSRNSDCGNFEFITKLFYNPLQSKHDIFLSERFRIIFIQDEEKNVTACGMRYSDFEQFMSVYRFFCIVPFVLSNYFN